MQDAGDTLTALAYVVAGLGVVERLWPEVPETD